MNKPVEKNQGIVRAGLVLLCTLVMASSALAFHVQGHVKCKGTNDYLAGIQVSAYDCTTGVQLPDSDTAVTDGNGWYELLLGYSNPGSYCLKLSLPDGFERTVGPIVWEDTPPVGDLVMRYDIELDCGGQECEIGDYVWLDLDGDGMQDHDEPGIPDVTVLVYDCSNEGAGPVASVVTDDDGLYLVQVPCGAYYRVEFIPPAPRADCFFTSANQGNDARDSDVIGQTGMTDCFEVTESIYTIDAGLVCEPCSACKGKVTQLTLQYYGDPTDIIKVIQKKDNQVLYCGDTTEFDGLFTFIGKDKDGTMGTEISIYRCVTCDTPGDGDEDCGCEGKVTYLAFEYEGPDGSDIKVIQKKPQVVLFDDTVDNGQVFTVSGADDKGTLGTEISIYVDGQEIKLHTSCSQPIGIGMPVGDVLTIVDGESLKGGTLCPYDSEDYKGKKKKDKKEKDKDGDLDGCTLLTKIHTSCSQPIGPGMVFGDFEVVEGYSRDGGLLCPEQPASDCGCEGKVIVLTFQYLGDTPAHIEIQQKKADDPVFEGWVAPGDQFTITGKDDKGTLGTEISIYIDGQLTKLHTSCSQPIGIGMVVGGVLEIVEGYSLKGGPLCDYDPDGYKGKKHKHDH